MGTSLAATSNNSRQCLSPQLELGQREKRQLRNLSGRRGKTSLSVLQATTEEKQLDQQSSQ